MTLFPVAQRELRVAARLPRTYYVRTLTAAVAFVVVGYAAVYARILGAGTGGRGLFLGLTVSVALVCLLSGVSATADAISRERREGTLGFLFLSHLSGFDVVLGKLLAQATHAFYALLAVMPMLALPFLDGGVTAGEFWWAMLALTNTLFFAVCLGLFTSSLSHEPRQATNAAVVGALFFWLGVPGLALLANTLQGPAWLAGAVSLLSPLSATAVVAGGAGGVPSPGLSLVVSHAEAWLFLAGASLFTRRAWQERPASRTRSRWQELRRRLALGPPERRAARRERLLDRGAFFWLTARHRWKPVLPLALMAFLLALLGLAWWIERGRTPPIPMAVILGGTLHLLLKFLVAGEAAAGVAVHRRQGTIELLLSTPLTPRDIIQGQFRAARWQFGTPLLATAVLTLGFPPLVAAMEGEPLDDHSVAVAILATAALFADACTLVWLASWRAIAARRVRHAAGSAVLRVLVLPWLILLVGAPFFRLGGFGEALALWALIGFISDFIWWQWARSQLLEYFRAAAEQGEGTGLWGRQLGRSWGRVGSR